MGRGRAGEEQSEKLDGKVKWMLKDGLQMEDRVHSIGEFRMVTTLKRTGTMYTSTIWAE